MTFGLAIAFAASLPLAAVARDGAPAPASRGVATSATSILNHPPAWTAEVAHATLSRINAALAPKAVAKTTPVAAVVAKAPVARKTVVKAVTAPRYAGTNHLWIPSLGISHSVAAFACTRSTPPGAGVYRWGCAGRNNAYLFGHAWSTLKPLHDAYVSGRLHTGMVAYYADGSGRVRAYKVTQIKVVTPDQVAWAIAAQSTPSLTLQTCVGSKSQYRLLVRLVATN
jgi:sortase (surface protein transpeptidase)